MSDEPRSGSDNIVIVHEQQTVVSVLRIVVLTEAETMPRVQPRRPRAKALFSRPDIIIGVRKAIMSPFRSLLAILGQPIVRLSRTRGMFRIRTTTANDDLRMQVMRARPWTL